MTPQQNIMFFWKVNSELMHAQSELRAAGIQMITRGFVIPQFASGNPGYRCKFDIRGVPATVYVKFDSDDHPIYTGMTDDAKHSVTIDHDCRPSDIVLKLSNELLAR